MKIVFVFVALLSYTFQLKAQQVYDIDFFDNQIDYYERALSKLENARLRGQIKEMIVFREVYLKAGIVNGVYVTEVKDTAQIKLRLKLNREDTTQIELRLKLNREGEIIEELNLNHLNYFQHKKIFKQYDWINDKYLFFKYSRNGYIKNIIASDTDNKKRPRYKQLWIYNKKGNLEERHTKKSLTKFTYFGDSVIYRLDYSNIHGKFVLKHRKKKYISLDNELKIVSGFKPIKDSHEQFDTQLDNPIWEDLYKYDTSGNLILTQKFEIDSMQNKILTAEKQYRYNSKNQLILERFEQFDPSYPKVLLQELDYDSNGQLKIKKSINGSDTTYLEYYQYNKFLNITSSTRQGHVTKFVYKYDSHDNWIYRETYSDNILVAINQRKISYFD